MNSIPLNFNISYNAQNSINKINNKSNKSNNLCKNNRYPNLDNDIQYPINNDWVIEETDIPNIYPRYRLNPINNDWVIEETDIYPRYRLNPINNNWVIE